MRAASGGLCVRNDDATRRPRVGELARTVLRRADRRVIFDAASQLALDRRAHGWLFEQSQPISIDLCPTDRRQAQGWWIRSSLIAAPARRRRAHERPDRL